ncbi:MAG: DsbA family protein [Acidimicrobiales bacterium]
MGTARGGGILSGMTDVAFYFDTWCPWTWVSSRWLVQQAQRQGFTITWRSFSVAHVNRDRKIPDKDRDHVEAGQRSHRIIQALTAKGDNEAIGRFYDAIGNRKHRQGAPLSAELVTAAAHDAGLDDAAVAAADDPSWDEAAARSTDEALALAGPDIGSPVLVIDGTGRFGPIIRAVPEPSEGDCLWDAVIAMNEVSVFYELKRGRAMGIDLESS